MQSDRFAREIIGILTVLVARSRRLMREALGAPSLLVANEVVAFLLQYDAVAHESPQARPI